MNKPRVLLVDDDRSVLGALGTVIESEGFEVLRAADGHEAIEKFRQQRIDIVLLDLKAAGTPSSGSGPSTFAADYRHHSAARCLSGRGGRGRRRCRLSASGYSLMRDLDRIWTQQDFSHGVNC